MIQGTISHYRILEKLGAGGMGEVYKALDLKLERTVAIKFLPAEELRPPGARERFVREARSAAGLHHPSITTIYAIDEADGYSYIVMRYVEGETLQARVRREPVSIQQALEWSIQVADGLTEAHAQGIVHRDIKAANIMITPRNRVEILDFGLAKKLPELLDRRGDETRAVSDSLTQTGTVVGTVDYLAPELLRGEAADARSDIFSVGVVLYETLTGQRPFLGRTPAETMNSILESEPQPLSRYAGEVPPELERIVSKALAKDRERRYQTMKDCAVDLENLRRSLEIESLMRSSQPRRIPSSSGAWDEPPNSGPRISGSSSTPDSRRIPSLPPLPRPRHLLFLLAASIVSGVALFAWAPPPLRSIRAFVQSPADVEHQAREQLTRRGISLYGYGSYTDAEGDPKLRQFEQHEKLSDEERRQIEAWSPRLWYRTLIVSADHEDRYEMHTSADGKLVSISHEMRPDVVSATISVDSATAIASDLLTKDFGVDLRRFEALPPAETIVKTRLLREFRWRLRGQLPRGAVGTALVRLSGPDVVESKLQVDLPPAVMRSIEQEKDPFLIAGLILLVGSVLGALIVAVRKRYFLFPDTRTFVFVTLAMCVFTVTGVDFRHDLVVNGSWAIFTSVVGAAIGAPFLAFLVCAVWGVSVAALGAERPALLAGLGNVLRFRVSKSTWARSAVVGLAAGALLQAVLTYTPWVLSTLGAAAWWPELVAPHQPRPWAVARQAALEGVFLGSVAMGGGVAALVLLQRAFRLRVWIWPLGAFIVGALTAGGDSLELQPAVFACVLGAIQAALFFFVSLRFGVLAAVLTAIAQKALQTGAGEAPAHIGYLRFEGFLVLGVWLLALAWSWFVARRNQPTIGR